MASSSNPNPNPNVNANNANWTHLENEVFEKALAKYDQDTPDRWQKVAREVVTKSAEEVKQRYELLVKDLNDIESGRYDPHPNTQSKKGLFIIVPGPPAYDWVF